MKIDFKSIWHRNFRHKVKVSADFSEERYSTAYPECQGKAITHFKKNGEKQQLFMYVEGDMGNKKAEPTNLQPLISVIMTSYNYEKYIGEALDSVMAQTYSNFEVIVVDDGSSDASVDIIESYVKKNPNVKLLRHEGGKNLGLPKTIRVGVEKAQGDYVAFCESDDRWAENHLEQKVKMINAYEDVAIISNAIKMFGNEEDIKVRGWVCQHIRKLLKQGGTPIDLRYNQSFNFIPTLSSVMIRKDVIQSLDYNTPVPAWIDFWLYRQILVSHILYFVDEELTFWRQHNSFNGLANSSKVVDMLPSFLEKSNKLIGL